MIALFFYCQIDQIARIRTGLSPLVSRSPERDVLFYFVL